MKFINFGMILIQLCSGENSGAIIQLSSVQFSSHPILANIKCPQPSKPKGDNGKEPKLNC